MDGGGGSRARYIDSHLETKKLTQKDILEWGLSFLFLYSPLKNHILTKKNISDWLIVMDGGGSRARFSTGNQHTYTKGYFRLGYIVMDGGGCEALCSYTHL
jgi:hypothetical protein